MSGLGGADSPELWEYTVLLTVPFADPNDPPASYTLTGGSVVVGSDNTKLVKIGRAHV
jgi:hypothetical protein